MRFPATAPIHLRLRIWDCRFFTHYGSSKGRAPACRRVSNTPLCGAAPQRPAKSQIPNGKLVRGRGRQVMPLLCKQVDVGALPTDSTISLRGTRLKHRAKPHKLRQVGVIPTPATNFREVIRLPACISGVFKQAGSDDWSDTSTSHHFWIRSSISGATRCLREG